MAEPKAAEPRRKALAARLVAAVPRVVAAQLVVVEQLAEAVPLEAVPLAVVRVVIPLRAVEQAARVEQDLQAAAAQAVA